MSTLKSLKIRMADLSDIDHLVRLRVLMQAEVNDYTDEKMKMFILKKFVDNFSIQFL